MKEADLDSLIDLQSSFDVFDENMPHISSLNNWLLGLNGTFFIILLNSISEFKKTFNHSVCSEFVFQVFFWSMLILLIFLGFQAYIKYMIFRITIKATPIKKAIYSYSINGKERYLKTSKILNDNSEILNLELINEETEKLRLLIGNSQLIKNDLLTLTDKRDKLIRFLNYSIFTSIVLGIVLGILFGIYLYFTIIN